ncbi:MAG: hypothetical protein RIT81_03685 [Deltaproteobacteria bacterium]
MPVNPTGPRPGALDLNRLAQHDPEAAEVGFALNHPAYGGVDLDGDPTRLTWDELAAAAPGFLNAYPQIQPALLRLRAAFASDPAPSAPPGNDPGPGFVDSASARGVTDAAGNENGRLVHVDGRPLLLFDRSDAQFSRSEVRFGAPGAASRPLLEGARLQASPSLAAGHVYLLRAERFDAPTAELVRVPFDGERAGSAEPIEGLEGLGPLSWPRVHQLPQGGFVAAYRDAASRPRIAYSDDGQRFVTLPGTVEPQGAAMVELGVFENGTLAMTYQRTLPDGSYVSYVRTSQDARTWSARRPITGASNNVHDTSLVRREDGGLDLYYVYTTPREGFALYRRALGEDEQLGPEQRVTRPGPDINKPVATRAPDGSLWVTFAEVTSRDPAGWVNGQQLRTVELDGDAPR